MAMLRPAAIMAYSIAVAPSSSARKRKSVQQSVLSFMLSPRSQQRHQVGDQRLVGRRHLVVAKLVRSDPGELLSLLGLNDALPAPANIERHQEMEVRIGVARKGERRQAR